MTPLKINDRSGKNSIQVEIGAGRNGTYLSERKIMSHLLVIPAKAGIQGSCKPAFKADTLTLLIRLLKYVTTR
jgi:hypothetical protein